MAACCVPGTVETSGNTSAMKVNAVAGHMKHLVKRPDISETMLKLKKITHGRYKMILSYFDGRNGLYWRQWAEANKAGR